jgi:hypothetical protein
MKRVRVGLALLGAVVASASCASILGIQDPETVGRGGQSNASTSSSTSSATGTGGSSAGGGPGSGGFGASSSSGVGGSGGAGGGVVCGPGKSHCPGADPPCVDEDTDSQHCGDCNHSCASTEACAGGSCFMPTPLMIDSPSQLTHLNGDYVATGLSVQVNGSQLAVGGTLSGADVLGLGNGVTNPNGFVWLTQTSPTIIDDGFTAICQGLKNCGMSAGAQVAGDVALGAAGKIQLVGDFGVASFDGLTFLGVDASLPGTGIGLNTDNGGQLAVGALDKVTLVALNMGQPGGVASGWPISFMPSGKVDTPVRIARVAGDVIVAGGIDGPGNVHLDNLSATVQGDREAFLAAFSDDLTNPRWFRTFPGSSHGLATITAIALDSPNGSDVYVLGRFQGSIDLVSSFCGKLVAPAGVTRMFAARFSLSPSPEACSWAKSFGGDPGDAGAGIDTPVAISAIGSNVAIVGSTTSTHANFGGQDLAVPAPLFLLVLDGGTGAHLVSMAWQGATTMTTGHPAGVGSQSDDLWIAGTYAGGDFTDLTLTPADPAKNSAYLFHITATQLPH